MRRFPTILILAALALGLGLPPLAAAQDHDIDKVNGSVQVAAGQQAGDVSTVNGAVHVGDGASVHEASTVNGEVELGDKAQATELGTVNGAISLGGASRVSGKVNAVNGSIHLAGWRTSTAPSCWMAPTSPAASAQWRATSRSVPTRASRAASWSTSRTTAGSTGAATASR